MNRPAPSPLATVAVLAARLLGGFLVLSSAVGMLRYTSTGDWLDVAICTALGVLGAGLYALPEWHAARYAPRNQLPPPPAAPQSPQPPILLDAEAADFAEWRAAQCRAEQERAERLAAGYDFLVIAGGLGALTIVVGLCAVLLTPR